MQYEVSSLWDPLLFYPNNRVPFCIFPPVLFLFFFNSHNKLPLYYLYYAFPDLEQKLLTLWIQFFESCMPSLETDSVFPFIVNIRKYVSNNSHLLLVFYPTFIFVDNSTYSKIIGLFYLLGPYVLKSHKIKTNWKEFD